MGATSIEATYRLVTPAFVGGADSKKSAELRPPTIKGQLRFWWRALAWARLQGDMEQLRAEEDELFGSTRTGQSSFLLSVVSEQRPVKLSPPRVLTDDDQVVGPGARYLGYGVMEAFGSSNKGTEAGQLTRPCINSSFEFKVKIRLKPIKVNNQSSCKRSAA